ncbi:MAG TPA: lipase family protein [Solirubrobacteraceae bacterium]|nr:lipase family protein [Solirubrobacteraceae bacterium]
MNRTLLSVSVALVVASAVVPSAASALTPPASDPFYAQPANIARYPHGTILRERQVTLSGPTQAEAAAAYQLMYATTNATGQPVAAVTTVMVPSMPAPGPRRLASYQTYYDSLTVNCAPSYTLQGGNNGGGTNGPTEQTMMSQLLQQGWDVVTSDYEGLNSEWAVGPMLGYATLDSITAVEHFAPAGLEGAKTEVTLNGYSGGSEASTWAAAFAPKYAANINIVGVAAGGNFPDLVYTTEHLDNSIWYGTEIGVLESFSRALPQDFDLSKLLNASGQALAAKDGQDGSGCAGSTLNEPYGNASQYTNFPSSVALADYPPVNRGLEELSLKNGPVPKAPLFLYNSVDDDLAFIEPVDAWVASYCRRGVTLDYDRDPAGGDHLTGIVPYWTAALTYLKNAFAGVKPPDNCST